jgi:hypothetical protein
VQFAVKMKKIYSEEEFNKLETKRRISKIDYGFSKWIEIMSWQYSHIYYLYS